MKVILSFFCWLLWAALPVFGQDAYTARLPVSGAFSELGVSPAEELWIATKAGNLYYTKQVGALWNYVYPKGPSNEEFALGETYERVTHFSENILMISGFIQDQGAQNFVYWSDNHGASWRKVTFGKSSWIDACYATASGKAWMSGSSQLIYYTEDSGRNWRQFPKVEAIGNLRFSTIHFAPDERTGLFGSYKDVLYRTTDNCRTWEKLPTPLSQHKYQKISAAQRPELRKVRLVGDYYILNQEGRVFITRANAIDWQRLPDVVDFEVSEAGKLYTLQKDLTVQLYDPGMRPRWRSTQRLAQAPRAITVRNEKLFAVTNDSAYRIEPTHFTVAALFTKQVAIAEPYQTVTYHGTQYGVEARDLLRFDPARQQWARFLTAPFYLTPATVFNGQLLLADGTLRNYYRLDENSKTLESIQLPPSLFSRQTHTLAEFHLERGSQGCFHASNSTRSYVRNGNQFELRKNEQLAAFLDRMASRIPASFLEKMVEELDNSRTQDVTFADLGLSERTVEDFNAFLAKEAIRLKSRKSIPYAPDELYQFPGENTDFSFYQRSAGTLASLSAKDLNNAFWQASGNWSTTRTWSRLIFVFDDGKKLFLENSDGQPNYLYTPWLGEYEGLPFGSNSIRFGQLVDEVTNGQFFPETVRDKKYAIFRIVNYLYQQKLLAEE